MEDEKAIIRRYPSKSRIQKPIPIGILCIAYCLQGILKCSAVGVADAVVIVAFPKQTAQSFMAYFINSGGCGVCGLCGATWVVEEIVMSCPLPALATSVRT